MVSKIGVPPLKGQISKELSVLKVIKLKFITILTEAG